MKMEFLMLILTQMLTKEKKRLDLVYNQKYIRKILNYIAIWNIYEGSGKVIRALTYLYSEHALSIFILPKVMVNADAARKSSWSFT